MLFRSVDGEPADQPLQRIPRLRHAIKTIEAYLRSYSYTYKEPGTYTATFVATNANLWNSQQQTIQLTIQVNEP